MENRKIAKVGDKVCIVNPMLAHGNYRYGDVFEVKRVFPYGCDIILNKSEVCYVYHREYKVVEGVTSPADKEIDWQGSQINWQVGQEVWCAVYGKGVVDAVLEDRNELEVRINGEVYLYDLKGCPFGSKVRTLFFSEPKVKIEGDEYPPKKPFTPTLKRGDKVVIDTGDRSFIATIKEEKEDEVLIERQVSGIYYPKNCIKIYKLGEEVKL